MNNVVYTVKEVSQLLKTNCDYVHKLRKAGRLKFLKLGAFKCRKEALEQFLLENEGKDLTNPYDVVNLLNKEAENEQANNT